MSGVRISDGELVVEREPNALDELAIQFSELLDIAGIDHVFIAGYVAILTGRARATNDIDVLIEKRSESAIESLVGTLEEAGFWGPAMPLENMYSSLSNGTNIWVAPDGQMTPHLEVKFPTDAYDRASLDGAMTARVGTSAVPIGPLELQIAYKLFLGGEKDLEDAAHLHGLFGETLRESELLHWVETLEVKDRYDQLD